MVFVAFPIFRYGDRSNAICAVAQKKTGYIQKNAENMYQLLLDRQADAIKHAKKLKAIHGPAATPGVCKPYTTVHELVERLNKLAIEAS